MDFQLQNIVKYHYIVKCNGYRRKIMAASPLRKSADIWGKICLINFLLLPNILFAQKRMPKEPRPSWIDKPQPGYFIGISQKLPEEADARTEALQNAKRQIIESLGSII